MSRPTAFAFSFTGLDGGSIRLVEHAGKPILFVNTGRDGRVAAVFSTQIEPMDARVIAAIEKQLRAP
jgi:glutathione peroxidase-family protein